MTKIEFTLLMKLMLDKLKNNEHKELQSLIEEILEEDKNK